MLAKVANALGISWYLVGDDDQNRAKEELKVKRNLGGAEEADRYVFPYPNIEVSLLRNGYASIYDNRMPEQNRRKITRVPGAAGYWQKYASKLPNRAKIRAAAEVAIAMEARGKDGVPPEIRAVLEWVVALARGDSQ